MRVAVWPMVVLLLAALSAGCSGQGDPKTPADGPVADGVLHGVIVDQAVRPLAGVQVSATPLGQLPLQFVTGSDGLFRFEGLVAGSYAVAAAKPNYLSQQSVVQVEAGVEDPPLLQLQMPFESGTIPYYNAIAWDGYIGCAFTYGNLCSVPAQGGADVIGDSSAHLFWNEFVSEQRVPDLVQGEAVWTASMPTSEELQPIYGWSEPVTWQQFGYLGTFHANDQRSPSFDRLGHDELLEAKVGTEAGLVVEFYSGGTTTAPTGLTVNQPIRLVLHAFYGYLPPDSWRFVTDGPPPGP